jgi:hypothetical protein
VPAILRKRAGCGMGEYEKGRRSAGLCVSCGCLQPLVLGLQLLVAFLMGRIKRDASDRTHLLALRLVEMADALRAFIGVDLVDQRAHENGLVRALGFADVAIDAIVGDH